MKNKLLFLSLFISTFLIAQTQIGSDIDGEAINDNSGYILNTNSSGSTIVIGAPFNDGKGDAAGHVRVYENIAGTWTQVGIDIDGDTANNRFGYAVDINADGSIIAVGAPGNGSVVSYVRIFGNIANVWTQIGNDILSENIADQFGRYISINSDGSVVAIGAPLNDGNGADSGHVRVYENNANTWTQIGTDIDGEVAGDQFGYSLSINSDGSIITVGAPKNDGNGSDSGHVRVYENIANVWTQIGTDIDGEFGGDQFGWSVSNNAIGNIITIGTPFNSGNGSNSGHVRVYKNSLNTWTQIGVDIDGEASGDQSGWAVSTNSEGNVIAIGARSNDGNGSNSGQTRVYQNILGVWNKQGVDIDGEFAGDYIGGAIGINSAGTVLAIGSAFNDDGGSNSGHVRIYNLASVLNISNPEIASSFTIYPNPVQDHLTINLKDYDFESLTLYNTLGQVIKESTDKHINISNLVSGIYYVAVTTTKGIGVKKIVIQ